MGSIIMTRLIINSVEGMVKWVIGKLVEPHGLL